VCSVSQADDKRRLHSLGGQTTEASNSRQSIGDERVLEPIFESDTLSAKQRSQEWLYSLFEELRTKRSATCIPTMLAAGPPQILRMHWIDTLISVICSDNEYGVRRTLETCR